MSARMKRRAAIVCAFVLLVLVGVMVLVGGSTAASTVTIAEASEGSAAGQKVQVSGNVVQGSYATDDDGLTFRIYDPDGDPSQELAVRYDGAPSSTFGNDVTAICTGRLGDDGVLQCSELVTKCPSKYEGAGTEHPSDIPLER